MFARRVVAALSLVLLYNSRYQYGEHSVSVNIFDLAGQRFFYEVYILMHS